MNFLFATTFIIGKAALNYSSPILFIAFRMVVAGILLLGYKFFYNGLSKIKKSDFKLIFLLSIIHIYIPYVFEYWALQYVSAAKASMLFNLAPFITAIFVFYLYNEKLSKIKIVGLIIGVLGFLPILLTQSTIEQSQPKVFFLSLPEIFLFISIFSASYAWIVIQNNLKQKDYSLITLNGFAMLIGGIFSFITAPLFENVAISNVKNFIWLTGLIIIIGNVICYNLYGWLLKKYSATFISFTGFSIPLFTALLQWFFFKELVSWAFFATAVFVAIGLYLFYEEELKVYNQ